MSSLPAAPGATSTRKRRRRTWDIGPRYWASLPEDLIRAVAWRVLASGDLLDYVRLRAVCSSWRSGADSPRGRGLADRRFHPRRWMMFPEGHRIYPGHPALRGCVRFLHLDTGALVSARVPLLGNSYWAVDSIDGLLLLVRDPDPDYGGAVRLLNPLTGDFADFPTLGTLLPHLGPQLHDYAPYRIRKLARVVSASLSFDAAGAMTVMLALPEVGRAAFATPLDQQWTLSSWEHEIKFPLSFQGKLYLLHTLRGEKDVHQVLQVDPPVQQDGAGGGRALPPPKLIATVPEDKLPNPLGLVECGSEILVVGNHFEMSGTQIFVYKLADLVLQRFVPIKSLGGNTLFIEGRNISVSSKILHTFKGDNVVYFTGSRIVQYHLHSDSLSTAVDDCSLFGHGAGASPLVLYVFSCCIRNPWSRGILFRKERSWIMN